jgi:hypothetical protein
MKRQDLINKYKADRSIKDSYKLSDDENYFIDKLEEAINYTRCCEELCQHKYQDVRYGTSRCVICGEEEQSF